MVLLFLFVFGLFVGSFINVVIDRTGSGESFLAGRSHCDFCSHTLYWYDLIPLFSFFLLGGKCRYCHKKLEFQYPFMEFLTGILFAISGFYFSPFVFSAPEIISIISLLGIVSCFIAIFFIDFKFGIIPDSLIITGSIFGIILSVVSNQLLSNILAGIGTLTFFLIIFLATRQKGIGFGDVKLGFLLGVFLGFPKVGLALYLAFVIGAVIGIFLVATKKKKFFGGVLPFGPFLIFGTMISFFFGNAILSYALHSLF